MEKMEIQAGKSKSFLKKQKINSDVPSWFLQKFHILWQDH